MGGSSELSEELSLEDFRQLVGEYWHKNLKRVDKKYRKLVSNIVNKSASTGVDRAAAKLAKDTPTILNKIISFNEAHVHPVFEKANQLVEIDAWTAYRMILRSKDLLEAGGIKCYEIVADSVMNWSDKGWMAKYEFIDCSPGILKRIMSVDEKYVPIIFETITRMNKKDGKKAERLGLHSSRILKEVISVNEDYVPLVFEAVNGIADDRGVSEACEFADNFKKEYKRMLGKIGEVGEEYIPVVLKAVDKVVGVDGYLGYRILVDSPRILREADSEITPEYILVSVIRDQKDVNLVNKLINSGKQDIDKNYDEVCGEFY